MHAPAYDALIDRLNRFPQGVAVSDTLYRILGLLFSEKEAGLVAQLPVRPFTAAEAAARWHVGEAEARNRLDALADRAILVDVDRQGTPCYCLPPPMAGFLEFSIMRVRGDVDQHLLAQLYYQYMNVEEDFIRNLFVGGETSFIRAFPNERALESSSANLARVHVLGHEKATEVVKTASHRAVSMCYCRHKMRHMDRACDAPMDICMTFNATAASLARHGYARAIDEKECIDLLEAAWDCNLVQCGENARTRVNFICNCCTCCCEALIAARRFGVLHPVETSNYLPEVDGSKCVGCGKCAQACPVEALGMVSAHDSQDRRRRKARLDPSVCLGCGVCVNTCPSGALRLGEREERVITPLDSTHRAVIMAIERGRLQDLIFDNRALWSHRAMAAVLGVILRLPPVKRALASRQMKSRYLEALLRKSSG